MHVTDKSPPDDASTFESLTPLGWMLALALGLGEMWLFAERFSTDALVLSHEAWAPWVRALRYHTPWCITVVAAIALAGGRDLKTELRELCATTARHATGVTSFFVHLGALCAFYLSTEALLEPASSEPERSAALPIAWVASAAFASFSLWSIVFPARRMAAAIWRLRYALAGGVAMGTAAYAIGSYFWERWPFWEPLARATLWLASLLVGAFASAPVYDEAAMVLGTSTFPVHVTRYCSGYEGVSLFLVFFSFFLVLYRDRLSFPRALILLPLGSLLVWTLNAVRIALLVAVGTLGSPEVAIEGFHVYAGWPFVAVAALTAVVVSTRVSWLGAPPDAERVCARANTTAAYLGPFLAIVATSMVAGAMTASPEMLYPLRIAAAAGVLWYYRRHYSELRLSFSWTSVLCGVTCAGVWLAFGFALESIDPVRHPLEWQAGKPPAVIAMWWCARTLGFVVIAPLCEELAFRGYLARRLSTHEFEHVAPRSLPLHACAISALLFGLAHDAWAAGLVVGLILAWAYRRRGNLCDAVLAHATANALLAAYAVASGDWWAWS